MAALALAAAFAAPAAAVGSARVRLVDRDPVSVVGAGFRPAERVTVTVTADTLSLRRVVSATGEGRISARWQRSLAEGCSAVLVRAVGSAGSRAVLKLPPPQCAPQQPADR